MPEPHLFGFSVNKTAKFQLMAQPLLDHWKAVKSTLQYLKGTINSGLVLQPASSQFPYSLHAYCDDD